MKAFPRDSAHSGMISRGNTLLAAGGGLALVFFFWLPRLISSPEGEQRAERKLPPAPQGAIQDEQRTPAQAELVAVIDPLEKAAQDSALASQAVQNSEPAAAAAAPLAPLAATGTASAPKLQIQSVPGAKKSKIRQEDIQRPKRKARDGTQPADSSAKQRPARQKSAAQDQGVVPKTQKAPKNAPVRKHPRKKKADPSHGEKSA